MYPLFDAAIIRKHCFRALAQQTEGKPQEIQQKRRA